MTRRIWLALVCVLLLSVFPAQAAITFDATGNGGRATALTQTFAHTCTCDLITVVVLHTAVENIVSVTYNGDALAILGTSHINNAGNYELSGWWLLAPDTGTHDVVVTMNAAADTMAVSASYLGVSQTGFPDASTYRKSQDNPAVETLTTTVTDDWMLIFGLDEFGTNPTTVRVTNSGFGGVFIADSNGSVGAAGSHTLSVTPSTGGNWMNHITIAFAPAGGGGGGPTPGAKLPLLGVGAE